MSKGIRETPQWVQDDFQLTSMTTLWLTCWLGRKHQSLDLISKATEFITNHASIPNESLQQAKSQPHPWSPDSGHFSYLANTSNTHHNASISPCIKLYALIRPNQPQTIVITLHQIDIKTPLPQLPWLVHDVTTRIM